MITKWELQALENESNGSNHITLSLSLRVFFFNIKSNFQISTEKIKENMTNNGEYTKLLDDDVIYSKNVSSV